MHLRSPFRRNCIFSFACSFTTSFPALLRVKGQTPNPRIWSPSRTVSSLSTFQSLSGFHHSQIFAEALFTTNRSPYWRIQAPLAPRCTLGSDVDCSSFFGLGSDTFRVPPPSLPLPWLGFELFRARSFSIFFPTRLNPPGDLPSITAASQLRRRVAPGLPCPPQRITCGLFLEVSAHFFGCPFLSGIQFFL